MDPPEYYSQQQQSTNQQQALISPSPGRPHSAAGVEGNHSSSKPHNNNNALISPSPEHDYPARPATANAGTWPPVYQSPAQLQQQIQAPLASGSGGVGSGGDTQISPSWAQQQQQGGLGNSSREARSQLLAQAAARFSGGGVDDTPVAPVGSSAPKRQKQPEEKPKENKPAAGGGKDDEEPPILRVGDVLRNWVITNRIGGGAFGETYTAVSTQAAPGKGGAIAGKDDRTSGNQEVCIKVERNDKRMVLRLEVLALKKVQACPNVVRYVSSGRQDDVNFLVMEKLGENLSELRRLTPNGAFELYTVLHIGIACVQAIQGIHQLGLVHRDIKPSNFVIGNTPETRRRVYLIDFGLAKRYRSSNGEMKPPRDNAGFRGTSRYASLNSHNHKELGRVDDLWSLLFMLVEFITGTLPWRKAKEKEVIAELKVAHVGPQLVSKLPREFTPFVQELMRLNYEDEPNYDLLIDLLHRCRKRREYPEYKPLDWEVGSSLPVSLTGQNSGGGLADGVAPGAVVAGGEATPHQKLSTADAMMMMGSTPIQSATPQLGPPEKKQKVKKSKTDKKDREKDGGGRTKKRNPEGDQYPQEQQQAETASFANVDVAMTQRNLQELDHHHHHQPQHHQSHHHHTRVPEEDVGGTFVDRMGPPVTGAPAVDPGLFGPMHKMPPGSVLPPPPPPPVSVQTPQEQAVSPAEQEAEQQQQQQPVALTTETQQQVPRPDSQQDGEMRHSAEQQLSEVLLATPTQSQPGDVQHVRASESGGESLPMMSSLAMISSLHPQTGMGPVSPDGTAVERVHTLDNLARVPDAANTLAAYDVEVAEQSPSQQPQQTGTTQQQHDPQPEVPLQTSEVPTSHPGPNAHHPQGSESGAIIQNALLAPPTVNSIRTDRSEYSNAEAVSPRGELEDGGHDSRTTLLRHPNDAAPGHHSTSPQQQNEYQNLDHAPGALQHSPSDQDLQENNNNPASNSPSPRSGANTQNKLSPRARESTTPSRKNSGQGGAKNNSPPNLRSSGEKNKEGAADAGDGFSELADAEADAIPNLDDQPGDSSGDGEKDGKKKNRVVKGNGGCADGCCSLM